MIHFVSDTHFGHFNIIKYSNRPFDTVEDMNSALIKNWNERVATSDIVYHLGDFAFMTLDQIKNVTKCLNGTKHLILGNHDKTIIQNKNDLLKCGSFNSIQNYYELKANGEFIVLFHYGQRVWNKSHRGSIMLYGHSHGSLPPLGKSVDVGVDCKEITSDYRPVSLDEVLTYMSKREFVAVDHHEGE
ncbi:MAG TPA: metallophosphoesterase family protein [Candidatus Saccharimonadales bacterium]